MHRSIPIYIFQTLPREEEYKMCQKYKHVKGTVLFQSLEKYYRSMKAQLATAEIAVPQIQHREILKNKRVWRENKSRRQREDFNLLE